MLQNKYSFNQSSTELVVYGLPDYSNEDDNDNISIVSSWKLSIINQPEIEGSIDHLKSVIKDFYKCAALSLFVSQPRTRALTSWPRFSSSSVM